MSCIDNLCRLESAYTQVPKLLRQDGAHTYCTSLHWTSCLTSQPDVNIVDLSHTLDGSVSIYPGDPIFSSCAHLTLPHDGVNVQKLNIGSHTGTHIDAPFHFVQEGRTIDDIPLEDLVGHAIVVNLTHSRSGRGLHKKDAITWQDVGPYEEEMKRRLAAGQRPIVLLKTGWSKYWGTEEYIEHPYLSGEAAQQIIDIGIRVIGVDTFSPDETFRESEPVPEPSFVVHKIVLGAGAIIAENLTNLDAIQDGEWIVSLVPLKLGGCDGSPVRACAWKKGSY